MKTAAIIPAGGTGERMGTEIAKQYLLLAGTPILIHTLRVFQNMHLVDDIFLIAPPHDLPSVKKIIWEKYDLKKVKAVIPGGKERQDSVRSGLDAIQGDHKIVVIHDAVRCLISEEIISSAIAGAAKYKAVTMGIPVRDTVKKVSNRGWVDQTITRTDLWLTQTPQAFQTSIIKEAYETAYSDRFYGTDDAELVERLGIRVRMLLGSYDNIKITTKEDLILAAILVNKKGNNL